MPFTCWKTEVNNNPSSLGDGNTKLIPIQIPDVSRTAVCIRNKLNIDMKGKPGKVI
jgi:hypothetical protein